MTCSNRYVYILAWCSVFVLSGLFFLAPTPASAALFSGPLVSCGNDIKVTNCDAGGGKPGKMVTGECSFCDVLDVAQNIINFLIFLGVIVATLLFCYAGVLYLFSAPSMGNIEKAHNIFWHVLIGLVITLAAWLIIDTIMKVLYSDGQGSEIKQRYGPWNEILCKSKVEPTCVAVEEKKSVDVGLEAARPTYIENNLQDPTVPFVTRVGQISRGKGNTAAYVESFEQAAKNAGIETMMIGGVAVRGADVLRAMMIQESGGGLDKFNVCNSLGYCGPMQIGVREAAAYGPAGSNQLTADELRARLTDRSNFDFSIQTAANYMRYLNDRYTTNTSLYQGVTYQGAPISAGDMAIAAYNGGMGNANARSVDCASGPAWACPTNPGGLVQTQNYVSNVSYMAQNCLASGATCVPPTR